MHFRQKMLAILFLISNIEKKLFLLATTAVVGSGLLLCDFYLSWRRFFGNLLRDDLDHFVIVQCQLRHDRLQLRDLAVLDTDLIAGLAEKISQIGQLGLQSRDISAN